MKFITLQKSHPCFLLALCLPMVVACIDVMAVSVAIDTIMRDFSASIAKAQWLLSAYTIGTAAFLIIIGKLADIYGRRKLYLLGVFIFSLSSFIAAFSTNIDILIFARFFQGIASAILMMSSIAIITHSFSPLERGPIIAKWGFALSLGMTAGPVVGGILIHLVNWRAIFWVNIPISILSYFLILYFIPESKNENACSEIDWLTVTLFSTTLILFISILSLVNNFSDTSSSTQFFGVLFVLTSTTFFIMEKKRKNPLIDFSLFNELNFTKSTLCGFVSYFCMYGWLFIISIYLQHNIEMSPLRTGIICMAFSVGFAVSIKTTVKIMRSLGNKRLIQSGFMLALITFTIMTSINKNTHLSELIILFLLLGISISFINIGSMTAALENIPTTKAGIASGTVFTIRWIAGSIGVVFLSLLFGLKGLPVSCLALAIIATIGFILASTLNPRVILKN